MAGWGEYLAVWAVFLLSHSIPVRPPARPWLVARLGPRGFGLAYSVLSLAVLGWMFMAAARAPHVTLWAEPAWGQWVVLAAMVVSALVLALGLGVPNPLSFGGAGNARFDPDRPGPVALIRHPVLVALLVWSAAHLLVNGDLAHVLLFGGFAGFAVLGMRLIDRRRQREMGPAAWSGVVARMKQAGPGWPASAWLRALGGLGAVLVLVVLHPWFAGVSVAFRYLP